MCSLCLQDFTFNLPKNPNLDQKKNRLLKIKYFLSNERICEEKASSLKEEQYLLAKDF